MLRKTKTRVLLLSCSVILLCLCMVVCAMFTWFTDSVEVTHHLNARNLNAVLKRTHLTYRVPDANGYLADYLNPDIVDFSNTTQDEQNVFGLGEDVAIIPGSYFQSDMSIYNNGTVAFTYDIKIELNDSNAAEELSKQILVTVSNPDGSKIVDSKPLNSNEANSNILVGKLEPKSTQSFIVRLDFINSDSNNSAQDQKVMFDMSVSAVQATKK